MAAQGIDLINFNAATVEFEVMIRPIKALAALGGEMGNRTGPQPRGLKQLAGIQPRFCRFLRASQAGRALARAGALWQGSARLGGALLGRFSYPRHAAVAQW